MTISPTPKRQLFLLAGLIILACSLAACGESSTGLTPTGTAEAPVKGYRIQGEVNPTQQAALDQLVAASSAPVDVLARGGQIEYLRLGVKIPDADAPSAQEKALLFLQQNQDLFQFGNFPQNLKLGQNTRDESGNTMVQLSQQYQGVPVYGSGFLIFVGQDDTIYSAQASYVPDLRVDVQPTVRSIQAEATALEHLNAEDGNLVETTTLQIYAPAVWDSTRTEFSPRLAWFVTVASESTWQLWLYIVDAQDGTILERIDLNIEAGAGLDLEIQEISPLSVNIYELVFTEDGVVSGTRPSEYSWNAFEHAWSIYLFYYASFGRVSYADAVDDIAAPVQAKLVIKVNEGNCWLTGATAFWNGTYIYFCQDFTEPPDVLNHEYTHAVMGSEVALVYGGEPRELNEAFADIFAAFASPEDSIWQLNWPIEDDDGDTILRDLENVKQGFEKDYPIHYTERYCNRDVSTCANKCPEYFGEYHESYADCGHANSLVFSHAAYLMSTDHDAAAGIPHEKLQYLYYEVMTKWLIPASQQKSAALSVLGACALNATGIKQFPNLDEPFTAQQCNHIEQAFIEVGLIEGEITPILPTPVPAYPITTPTPYPPTDGEAEPWWDIDIDQIIADLLHKLQDWFDNLIDQLMQGLWQGLLDFLNNLTQQCCTGGVPLLLLPSGLLLKRWRRRHKP